MSLRTSRRARRAAARREAEQHKAARKAARAERLAREVRLAAALAHRPARVVPPSDAALVAVRKLLALAAAGPALRGRTLDVLGALARELPTLVVCSELPWVLLLAGSPWARTPRSFRAPPGGTEERREALVRHLLGPFPVPAFLRRALDVPRIPVARVPLEHRWAVDLYATVAGGRSLRASVGRLLPGGFTRAMCHLLSTTPGAPRPVEALRRAQVLGWGGPPALAGTLAATRLGGWQGPQAEAGWHRVVGWLCARPWTHALDAEALDALLGWLADGLSRDPATLEVARSEASVARAVEAWQRLREADPTPIGSSGLCGYRQGDVVIRELRSTRELVEEGQRMGHCVGQYAPLVEARQVAIFSLRAPGRAATVEVLPHLRRVVQIKGARNRTPSAATRADVARWAAQNALVVTLGD